MRRFAKRGAAKESLATVDTQNGVARWSYDKALGTYLNGEQ